MRSRARHQLFALAAVVLVAALVAGCGAKNTSQLGSIDNPNSSWIAGEPSLIALPGFRAIEVRASLLAAQREAGRKLELARLAAAKLAAKKAAEDRAKRAYEEARRRAEAAYKAAVEKARIARAKALARLRKAQAEQRRKLAEIERKLRVQPGEECKLPGVRDSYKCRVGHLPTRPAKK